MSSIRQLRKRQQRKVTGFQHRAALMRNLLSNCARMPRMEHSILELDYMRAVDNSSGIDCIDTLLVKAHSIFNRQLTRPVQPVNLDNYGE